MYLCYVRTLCYVPYWVSILAYPTNTGCIMPSLGSGHLLITGEGESMLKVFPNLLCLPLLHYQHCSNLTWAAPFTMHLLYTKKGRVTFSSSPLSKRALSDDFPPLKDRNLFDLPKFTNKNLTAP